MVWRVCGGGDWFVDAIAIKEKTEEYFVQGVKIPVRSHQTHVSVSTAYFTLRTPLMFSASRPSILLWI